MHTNENEGQPGRPGRNSIEWIAAGAIFVLVTVFTAWFQKPLTYQGGAGWDGVSYQAVARCFSSGQRPAAAAPFVYRIAGPFLAAAANPRDLAAGFETVDLAACALTAVLFILWMRLHLRDWRVRLLMLLLYLTQFFGPARNSHWCPFASDSLTHLGIVSGMLLLASLRRASTVVSVCSMACFAVLGVAIREAMLLFPIALFFSANPVSIDTAAPFPFQLRRRPSPWLVVPVALGALALYAIRHWVITLPGDYHPREELGTMLFTKGLVPYLHGWFIAFGPVLVLLLWRARDTFAYLFRRQAELVVLLGIALLGWCAGTDTERFLFWSFPILYVLLGLVIEANRWLGGHGFLVAAWAIAQAVSQRIGWPLPDYPPAAERTWMILTAWGSRVNYLNLWSWHAQRALAIVSFAEYLCVAGLLLVFLRRAESRRPMTSEVARRPAAAGAAI